MITPCLEEIYAHYCNFCRAVGIETPMTPRIWFLTTDSVFKGSLPVFKPSLSTLPKYCPPRNPEKDLRAARAKADGLVRQVGSTSREGLFTLKNCSVCGKLLDLSEFSKQGKSIRAACKACDNSRRVARRNGLPVSQKNGSAPKSGMTFKFIEAPDLCPIDANPTASTWSLAEAHEVWG